MSDLDKLTFSRGEHSGRVTVTLPEAREGHAALIVKKFNHMTVTGDGLRCVVENSLSVTANPAHPFLYKLKWLHGVCPWMARHRWVVVRAS